MVAARTSSSRWGAGDAERYRRYARELVALAPDVILADGSSSVAVLQQATRTVPIVFAGIIDPVGAGLIKSLARPGGNATGLRRSNTRSPRNGLNYSKRSHRA